MSDWIPVPEIENVLAVVATLADTPEAIAQAPAMALLQQLKQWESGSVYVFHDPPEAGEVLEDADPDMAARFALAAQMSDHRGEVCRDAFRRVFSRATVQRVVLVAADNSNLAAGKVEELFVALSHADMVWAGEWPRQFALGLRQFQPQIFSDAAVDNFDLRKAAEDVAAASGLSFNDLGAL